jgi:hypothetical protein
MESVVDCRWLGSDYRSLRRKEKNSSPLDRTKKNICIKQPTNEIFLLEVTKFLKVLGVMTFE